MVPTPFFCAKYTRENALDCEIKELVVCKMVGRVHQSPTSLVLSSPSYTKVRSRGVSCVYRISKKRWTSIGFQKIFFFQICSQVEHISQARKDKVSCILYIIQTKRISKLFFTIIKNKVNLFDLHSVIQHIWLCAVLSHLCTFTISLCSP